MPVYLAVVAETEAEARELLAEAHVTQATVVHVEPPGLEECVTGSPTFVFDAEVDGGSEEMEDRLSDHFTLEGVEDGPFEYI